MLCRLSLTAHQEPSGGDKEGGEDNESGHTEALLTALTKVQHPPRDPQGGYLSAGGCGVSMVHNLFSSCGPATVSVRLGAYWMIRRMTGS